MYANSKYNRNNNNMPNTNIVHAQTRHAMQMKATTAPAQTKNYSADRAQCVCEIMAAKTTTQLTFLNKATERSDNTTATTTTTTTCNTKKFSLFLLRKLINLKTQAFEQVQQQTHWHAGSSVIRQRQQLQQQTQGISADSVTAAPVPSKPMEEEQQQHKLKQHQQQQQQQPPPLCHTTALCVFAIAIVQLRQFSFNLLLFLLLFTLQTHVPSVRAAPQSCIYCREEDLKMQQQISPQHIKESSKNYEEFLFEHQVTRKDAINALKTLNETFYLGPAPESSCKSVVCNKNVMNYCLGPQFINDHCWCELGHTDEGLPFVPHICYVGEKTYKASVGSCFFYEEVKECCCAPALATQWRHISGTTAAVTTPKYLLIYMLLLIYLAGHKYVQ